MSSAHGGTRFLHRLLLPGLIVLQVMLILIRDIKDENQAIPFPLRQKIRITGTIQKNEALDFGTRLTLKPKNTSESPFGKARDLVQITINNNCPIPVGATVTLTSKLTRAKGFLNPGVFDYATHLRRQGVRARGYVHRCADIVVLNHDQPDFFERTRKKIQDEIKSSGLKNADLVLMLTLGDPARSSPTSDLIRAAGLSHLVTISGLHFGMMVAMLGFVLGFALKHLTPTFLGWPRQKTLAMACLTFVICYTLITCGHPAIRRSAIMISIYLLARVLNKQANLNHIFLFSILADLLLYPFDMFLLSFQLSYLCVGVLIFVYPRIKKFLAREGSHHLVQKYLDLIGVSVLLTLLLGPLLMASFGEMNLSGIFHNLWAIPVFEFMIMPVGLVYIILSLFNLPGSTMILKFWDLCLEWFLKFLSWISQWQPPTLDLPAPHDIHLILFYAVVFALCCSRKKIYGGFMFLLLVLSFWGTHLENTGFDLRLTLLDVGQGDAILIETPARTALIDTGGNRFLDIGDMVVVPFLKYRWIRGLDLIVLTHADMDHYGGMAGLIKKISVREVWTNGKKSTDRNYADLLQQITAKKIPLATPSHQQIINLDLTTRLEILSPAPELALGKNDNDHSLFMRLTQGDFCALFTGDISTPAEKKIVARYGQKLNCKWLKVAHHGSAGSSSDVFLKAVKPDFALIGVGKDSQFGHPRPETLFRLEKAGAQIFRTDWDGAITTTVKNGRIEIKTHNQH